MSRKFDYSFRDECKDCKILEEYLEQESQLLGFEKSNSVKLGSVDKVLTGTSYILNAVKKLYMIRDVDKFLKSMCNMLMDLTGANACFVFMKMGDNLKQLYPIDDSYCINYNHTHIGYVDDKHLVAAIPLSGEDYKVNYLIVLQHKNKENFIDEHVSILQLLQPVLYSLLHTSVEFAILSNEVMKDELTGAYNRRYFNKMYDYVYRLYDFNFVLCSFDIDNFKKINDTYSHEAGDIVLKAIVNITENSIRDYDSLFRVGGEEFIIIFRYVSDAKIIRSRVEYIRKRIEDTVVKYGNHDIRVTCSYGIVGGSDIETILSYDSSVTKEDILNLLDKALYHSKNTGKNKVTTYGFNEYLKSTPSI